MDQKFYTLQELKELLETLSEKELKQPVRFLNTQYGTYEVYRIGELAVDEFGLILAE